jgi:outer membrane biosynthesis protein TonB
MKRVLTGLLIAMLSHVALAGTRADVRKQVQASLLVTGTVDVGADGSVKSYSIDRSDVLPKPVDELIAKGVPNWKFEPATQNGNPVQTKAKMTLRIVAKYLDKDHMSITFGGAQFPKENVQPGENVSYKDRPQPKYPQEAIDARVSGTVYLLLRIGPHGEVQDVAAEQVNLALVDNEMKMKHWRTVLGETALRAARRWTFNTPTSGEHVHDAYWVARVPVRFNLLPMGAREVDTYGQWDVYVPGPVQPPLWPDKDKMFTGAPDAMAGEGLFQLTRVYA